MSTETTKAKPPKPICCIDCGTHFSDNPALAGRRCPKCSVVPSHIHRERLGEWARDQFTEASRRYFSR
jgi:predicted  nucleic acid-binding Zn-ribbon protein